MVAMRHENPTPFVSVVISTRDRTESLERCLDSLAVLEYPNYEIIVVDNAPSTDATRRLIERFASPHQIRYLLEIQPGLAIAHNRGALLAEGDILAFTDDDVEVQPDWLDQIVGGFQLANNVGCVTGAITPAEVETEAQVLLEEFGGYHKGHEMRLYDMDSNRPPNRLFPYSSGMLGGGANMAFSRVAFTKIGGFDPALGVGSPARGGDDLASFFDVLTHGFALVYAPGAVVRHWHRRDMEGLKRVVDGYGVGLTAFLTRVVVDNPKRLLDILPRLPSALVHAFSPRSTKNVKKSGTYPSELTWLERVGMAKGPFAYFRSLRASGTARSDRWAMFDDAWLRRPAMVEPELARSDEA